MALLEDVGFKDYLDIEVIRDGKVVDRRTTLGHSKLAIWLSKLLQKLGYKKFTNDLITNTGRSIIARNLTNTFKYVAIGSDDGTTHALNATNTALGAELQRVKATVSTGTTNVTGDTAVFRATFSFKAAATVRESGIFNAPTAGHMLCRQTFAALNLNAGDSLAVTWKIVVR